MRSHVAQGSGLRARKQPSDRSPQPPTPSLAALTVSAYAAAVGSEAPAPGAGSVAALAAALAAGLNEKVARHAKDAPLRRLAATMARARRRLLQLVDADARRYQAVVAARKAAPLPATGKSTRQAGVVKRRAFIAATKIPLTICADSAMISDVANRLALHAKGSIKADAVAAEALAGAALAAARLMVEANLPFVDDAAFVQAVRKTLEQYLPASEDSCGQAGTDACCHP